MNQPSPPAAPDASKQSPESSALNRAWNLWARTLGVLMLAYPDAKLTDQEIAAKTALYCESLAPVWRNETTIQRAMAKGRLSWKFFPTVAEINAALEREADRITRESQPTIRERHFAQIEDHRPREPMTLEQSALIEKAKNHLTMRAKEAHKLPPVPPHMVETKARDRSRVTAGASPEWIALMEQPTP